MVLTALLALFFLALAVGGVELARGLGFLMSDAASTSGGRVTLAVGALIVIGAALLLMLRAMGFGKSTVIEFESDAGQMVRESGTA